MLDYPPLRRMTAAQFQDKEIIHDFTQATGSPAPAPGSATLYRNSAAAYVAMLVLGDIRPPWAADDHFPAQVTTTDSQRHSWKILRHSFLQWDLNALVIFGEAICRQLAKLCKQRGHSLVGCVAQPTFSCTAPAPGSAVLCGRRAAMTPLLDGHLQISNWRCSLCREKRESTTDDTPRRVLLLWPVVETTKKRTTALRTGGIEAVVSKPPSGWSWPHTSKQWSPSPFDQSTPLSAQAPTGRTRWVFNTQESDAIWQASRRYQPA